LVDPFWGADGGNVFVGACSPFGMVRLGPDCPFPTPTSGYKSDKPIIGFSHNHLSGTGGGGRYGNILLTPQVGVPDWKKRESESKENEMASPSYYLVELIRQAGKVKAELTANQNLGRSRFTYSNGSESKSIQASLLFDISSCIGRKPKEMFKGCKIHAEKDGSFSGQASFTGGWGGDNPYILYFSGQANMKNASLQFKADTTWLPVPKGSKKKPGFTLDTTGFALTASVPNGEVVETSVSISYKNLDETRFALQKSLTMTFEEVKDKTLQSWEDRLSVFTIETNSPEEKKMFFSSLYHTLIMPTDVTGHHPDDQFGEAHFWEHYCFWDVFRTLMPLHNLLYPAEQKRIMGSLIRIGEKRGWLPDAWIAGNFAMAQGGANAEVILAEAVVKGLLLPSDAAKAWKVCYKNATTPSDHPEWYGRNAQYLEKGFNDSRIVNGTSKSLEYACNDFAIAQMAKKLGKISEYNAMTKRSFQALNLWYPTRKFFWSKDSVNQWMPSFTTEFTRSDHWNGPHFYEGNPWTYFLGAPHLADTIRSLMGGTAAYESRLDSIFDGNHTDMGNEPGFMLPYGYMFSGNREKTTKRVHELLKSKYVSGRKGLPGQDDSGALSSWLIWGYLGIYPLAGTDEYWLISPYCKEVEITLPGGKSMKISGSGKQPYLNGKIFKSLKIKHVDLLAGGKIEWKPS